MPLRVGTFFSSVVELPREAKLRKAFRVLEALFYLVEQTTQFVPSLVCSFFRSKQMNYSNKSGQAKAYVRMHIQPSAPCSPTVHARR